MRRHLCFLVAAIALGQSETTIRLLEIDGRTVPYTIENGLAITQGDIIIGRAVDVESYRTKIARGEPAARPQSVHIPVPGTVKLWTNATMYYTMEPDVPLQQNLNAAID